MKEEKERAVEFGIVESELVVPELVESGVVESGVVESVAIESNVIESSVVETGIVESEVSELLDGINIEAQFGDLFSYHYQPQLCLEKGRVRGYECLLRLIHPTRGLMLPGIFIHKLESKSIWENLWPVMLRKLGKAQKRVGSKMKLSVNVSPIELERGEYSAFLYHFNAMIKSGKIDPKQIEVELTEDMIINDLEQVERSLFLLKGYGTEVVVDDFGAGYCGLGHLEKLNIQGVKVDRSLIAGLESSEVKQAIVESVVNIARVKKCYVLAEGLERKIEVDFALKLGCRYGQGFIFGQANPSFVHSVDF